MIGCSHFLSTTREERSLQSALRIAMHNRIASALSFAVLAAAAIPAVAQSQIWIRQFGTSSYDSSFAVASDGQGGTYVGGRTTGNLGGQNAGIDDAWLALYDGNGNQTWLRQFGTSGQEAISACTPDGAGGVFVGGFTSGSLGAPNAGDLDAWFARYDSLGNRTWIRQLGTPMPDRVNICAPDGSGGVYVGGRTAGDLGGPGAGGDDAWLARYDAVGNQMWIRQFGSIGADYLFASAADGTGGTFVGG